MKLEIQHAYGSDLDYVEFGQDVLESEFDLEDPDFDTYRLFQDGYLYGANLGSNYDELVDQGCSVSKFGLTPVPGAGDFRKKEV